MGNIYKSLNNSNFMKIVQPNKNLKEGTIFQYLGEDEFSKEIFAVVGYEGLSMQVVGITNPTIEGFVQINDIPKEDKMNILFHLK